MSAVVSPGARTRYSSPAKRREMMRAYSIRRRLAVISILGGLLFVGSAVGFGSLRSAVRAHLDEVAADEVRHDLAGLAAGSAHGELSGRPCRAGTLRGGVHIAGDVRSLPGSPLADPARAKLEQLIATQMPAIARVTDGDRTFIVGIEPLGDGRTVWSILDVDDPPEILRSRLVGALLGVLVLVLVGASVHLAWAVRRAVAGLSRTVERLGVSLDAPVERSGLVELVPVEEGIARLAGELSRGITDRERLARALAEEERLATLGRVAAGLAHELRNPLAAMKLRVDLARGGETSRLGEDLATISEEIVRLDRLVGDLLLYAGTKQTGRVPCDLAALARRRADVLFPAREERARFHIEGAGQAVIDVDCVSRLIDNLLMNALEASPPTRPIDVRVREAGADMDVEVRDDGPGVPAEAAAQLFEPFFTTKPGGVGLGLALSRAIARSHGGDLSYERHEARTVFRLRLPRALSTRRADFEGRAP